VHLTIDGYGGNREQLGNVEMVRSLLDTYPAQINMTKISEPYVIRYVGEKPEDWGVTGFVIIAESHIAVHTFPEHGYVWVDIFSCKGFEAEGTTDRIIEEFRLTHVTQKIHDRGLEYPHAVDAATPVAMLERSNVTGELSGAKV
jgi:S-adenosylmethionine decarboxylase